MYVGRNVGTALARFEKHVQCARAGSEKPVHVWIAKRGFRNVFVFPLEHVPIPEARTWEAREKLFKAGVYERVALDNETSLWEIEIERSERAGGNSTGQPA